MPDLIESHVWRSVVESPDGTTRVIETLIPGPAGPPGASGADIVVGETPSGTINGSNATFAAANDFIPESVAVFVNGLFQQRVTDFNTSGVRTITLATSPAAGEVVRINYTRAS